MSPTLNQLAFGIRKQKRRKLRAPAFDGAPNRRGVIYRIASMSPRKPNSAKRAYAKVRIVCNNKRVFAKIPGMGPHYLQAHSVVFVRGHGPKDSPGVNYHLVRSVYDFDRLEFFDRRKGRSKYGVPRFDKITK